MRLIKGLNQDINSADLPEGFYNFAKNILLTSTSGVIENEDGFLYSNINSSLYGTFILQNYRPIGTIVTKLFTIIFLTNDVNSIIGAYYEDSDTFTVLYDDTLKPSLGLTKQFPVKGEWYENFLGEIIIGFTDNNNKPKVINLSDINNINEEKDILLFPEFEQPTINTEILDGGSLRSGTYFVYIQYENNNGTVTDWSLSSSSLYITDDGQTNSPNNFNGIGQVITTKQIHISLSEIDVSYDKLNVAVRYSILGDQSISYKQIITQDIFTSTMEVYITSIETGTVLTADEVIVKAPLYTKAKAITSLQSQLYLGNLQTDSSLNLQQYFNQVNVKWVYEEVTETNKKLPRYSFPKSFAHNEVYALYAIGVTKAGKVTQPFHIPGRAVKQITVTTKLIDENAKIAATDNLPTQIGYTGTTTYLSEDNLLSPNNVRYFQTRETSTWDTVNQKGELGFWENESEFYPNSPEWGTLIGQKVRHHKFPSFQFIKDNVYTGDTNYSLSKIDRLGIVLEGLVLPQNIIDQLDYITIGYAKRDFNNSLVISNERSVFCGFNRTVYDADQDEAPNSWGTYNSWTPIALGARFESLKSADGSFYKQQYSIQYPSNHGGSGGGIETATYGDSVDFFVLKAHSPEVSKIQPQLGGCYIKTHLKYINQPAIEYYDSTFPVTNTYNKVIYQNDLINGGTKAVKSVADSSQISVIKDFLYVIPDNDAQSGISLSQVLNKAEEGVLLKVRKFVNVLDDDSSETIADDDIHLKYFGRQNSAGAVVYSDIGASGLDFSLTSVVPPLNIGISSTINDANPVYAGYLYSIMKYLQNCYTSFNNQTILYTSKLIPITDLTQSTYNADCFLDSYGFHTATSFRDSPSRILPLDPTGVTNTFRARTYSFTETVVNIGLRQDESSVTDMTTGTPNTFTINRDFNILPDTIEEPIFYTSKTFTNSFPHRIIQSLPVTTESKRVQWKEYLPLDYYEINKSKGFIVNLQAYRDQLLIHTQRALFFTRNNQQIETSGGTAQLGNGDIFEFPPLEVTPTKEGYTGTQHIFSCLLWKEGYCWIDAEQGKVFNFSSDLKELSDQGLTNFFKSNLGLFEDNPFTSDGITVAWDNNYRRLLFTVKNNNKDYTLSYVPELNNQGGWASFHDYISDHLFNTRKNTFSFRGGYLYRHNNPLVKGEFYEQLKYPSFVDGVFNNPRNINLNSIKWYTQYINQNKSTDFYKTLSSISVWNQYQHSGKILLDNQQLSIANNYNSRNTESDWHFNMFRDSVIDRNLPIIQDLFNNFDPVTTNVNQTQVWFDKMLLNNKWFIVRFEFDNTQNVTVQLYDVDFNTTISYR